jgi:hypothetical protein
MECWQRYTKELVKLAYKQLFEDEGKKDKQALQKALKFRR